MLCRNTGFYCALRQKAKHLIYNEKYETNACHLQKSEGFFVKALFDDRQWAHDPKHFVNSGPIADNPERLKRIEVLATA